MAGPDSDLQSPATKRTVVMFVLTLPRQVQTLGREWGREPRRWLQNPRKNSGWVSSKY